MTNNGGDIIKEANQINRKRYSAKRKIIALLEQMNDEELAALLQELREKGFWWLPAEER